MIELVCDITVRVLSITVGFMIASVFMTILGS